ncbi:MAG: hypothetical protein SGBAC_008175 [Bacillariaceae sp.]
MPQFWIVLVALLFETNVSSFQTHRQCATTRSPTTTTSRSQLSPYIKSPFSLSFDQRSNNLVGYAIIYGGDDGDYQSEEEFDSSISIASGDRALKQSVAERIYSDFPASFLTNIACAQAPPPHNHILPKDCISAELISVDTQGAQIAISTMASAGGKGDGRCVQILIPIKFAADESPPPSTEPSLILDYIVQKFQQLESASMKTIANKEWEEDYADQLAAQEKIVFELQDEASLTDKLLPDWWTFCELNKGLEEESGDMKDLLNEDDFATDLNVLFQSNYDHGDGNSPIQPIKTCVTSIGPSGVYLRSYAERQEEEADEKYFIAKLSIPFPKKSSSRDDLRMSVLIMIENAEEQVVTATAEEEEVPLLETAPSTVEVVVDKAYAFQEQLLRARIQVDQLVSKRVRAKKEEGVHRSLLAARLAIKEKQAKTGAPMRKSAEVASPSKQQQQQQQQKEQPLSRSIEKELAYKYANIEDIGERAYTILKDLNMV